MDSLDLTYHLADLSIFFLFLFHPSITVKSCSKSHPDSLSIHLSSFCWRVDQDWIINSIASIFFKSKPICATLPSN